MTAVSASSPLKKVQAQFYQVIGHSPNTNASTIKTGRDLPEALHSQEFKVSFNDYQDGNFSGSVRTGGRDYPIQFSWNGQSSAKRIDLRNTGTIVADDHTFQYGYSYEGSELHRALLAAAKIFVLKPLEQSTPLISWTQVRANGTRILRYEGTLTTSSQDIFKISYKPKSKLLIIDGYNFGFMIDQNYPNLTRAINDAIKATPPDTIE